MFSIEERQVLKQALTEGIDIESDVDIAELTMEIWQHIAELPHSVDSNFNIMGNSSIINVLNENKDPILSVNINPQQINFSLCIPEYKFTHSDKMSAAFATYAVVNCFFKICAKQIEA
jgi:hypothetical protein